MCFLLQIDVDWQYPGQGNMTMGYGEIALYMPEIRRFFAPKTQKLSKKRIFRVIYERHHGAAHQKEKSIDRARKMYKLITEMAPDGENEFTLPMVASLTRPQLREIVKLIETHYSAGTTEYEYSYFTPETVTQICRSVAEANNGILSKENYVKAYVDSNGSRKLAEEFWARLVGEGKEVEETTFSSVEPNLEYALEKYEFYREEPQEEGDEREEDEEENQRNSIPNSDFKSEFRGERPDFRDSGESEKEDEKVAETERKIDEL